MVKGSAGMAQSAEAPAPKLTRAEREFVRSIESRLGRDRNAWYVLMFRDLAGAATQTTSSSIQGRYKIRRIERKLEAANRDYAVVVQGRREAAITIARFLVNANTAAADLKARPSNARNRSTLFGGDKLWDYRTFLTQQEAEKFLEVIKPAKKR